MPKRSKKMQDASMQREGLPVFRVRAGFPSPAEDFAEDRLDIARYLVRNPESTFFARVVGNSMKQVGIAEGDLLVVDRSLLPADGRIAVCFLNGEFTLKTFRIRNGKCLLVPANPEYPPIEVNPDEQFMVWGIVTHAIKSF